MSEYEYKLVAASVIFYYALFVFIGYLGMAQAVELDYENINPYTGAKAIITNPFESSTIGAMFFSFMLLLPLGLVTTMILLNYVRNR